MYLDYIEYITMGGDIEESAFARLSRKAEYAINTQAAGNTGKRLANLAQIPAAVKDCVFELICYYAKLPNEHIKSESQASGGVSESVSYIDEAQNAQNVDDIIYNTFFGGGCGDLLYRGNS